MNREAFETQYKVNKDFPDNFPRVENNSFFLNLIDKLKSANKPLPENELISIPLY